MSFSVQAIRYPRVLHFHLGGGRGGRADFRDPIDENCYSNKPPPCVFESGLSLMSLPLLKVDVEGLKGQVQARKLRDDAEKLRDEALGKISAPFPYFPRFVPGC